MTSMPSPIARPAPVGAHDLLGRLARPRRVEIAHQHVGALGGQPLGRGAPDAARAPGDERDAPGQLLLGRGQRELVELERPVLDVEGLPRRERDVAAERGGGAQHRDRVVVDVVHDAGGAPVLAGGEEPEPAHHDHARERIGERGPFRVVGLEVRGVVGHEALDRGGDAGPDRLGIRRVGDRGEARQPLGEDRVIRGRGADPAEGVGLARGRELEHVRRVVEEEHLPSALADQAAQVRRHREGHPAPGLRGRARHRDAAEAHAPLRAVGDRLLGAADQLDRGLVGLLHRGAPADRPVLLEQDRARLRMRREHGGHLARDQEPGPAVGERDDLVAVHLPEHVAAPVVVGERDDRVGVGVDHRRRGQEAVQQGLDGRARARRLLQRVGEIVHHLLVAHVLALEQRQHVVHPHAREVLLLDALEVGPAALHPQHAGGPAAVIALVLLDRRVAPAPDHQGGLGPDQARGVDEEIEIALALRVGVAPAGVHRALTIPESAMAVKIAGRYRGRVTAWTRTGSGRWARRWPSSSWGRPSPRPVPAWRGPTASCSSRPARSGWAATPTPPTKAPAPRLRARLLARPQQGDQPRARAVPRGPRPPEPGGRGLLRSRRPRRPHPPARRPLHRRPGLRGASRGGGLLVRRPRLLPLARQAAARPRPSGRRPPAGSIAAATRGATSRRTPSARSSDAPTTPPSAATSARPAPGPPGCRTCSATCGSGRPRPTDPTPTDRTTGARRRPRVARVVRGASHDDPLDALRVTIRRHSSYDGGRGGLAHGHHHAGFRCATSEDLGGR